MNKSRNPYFSLQGLAFREAGSIAETRINIQVASEVLKSFAMYGGNYDEPLRAIEFIEQECPKVHIITERMRSVFFDDDKFPDVDKGRLRRMKIQMCCDLESRIGQIIER
jgi:hypothetical protein